MSMSTGIRGTSVVLLALARSALAAAQAPLGDDVCPDASLGCAPALDDHLHLMQRPLNFVSEPQQSPDAPPIAGVMHGKNEPKIILAQDVDSPPHAYVATPPEGDVDVVVLTASAAAGDAAQSTGQRVSPIQKVIQMMNDMVAKGKAEKQDETVRFAQFKEFCDKTSEEKKEVIAEATDQVENLKAKMQQAAANAAKLDKEIAALNPDIASGKAEVDKATKNRRKNLKKKKAEAEKIETVFDGLLAETSQMLAEDKKFLADMTAECETKSSDYEKRQEVRQGEIEAIYKAIEMMSGPGVSGGAAFPQTVQSPGQLRSKSRTAAQDLVTAFLQDRARSSDSKILSLIASRASDEPFKKVTRVQKRKEEIESLREALKILSE